MRKLVVVICLGLLGLITQARAQTPAQTSEKPRAATAPKAGVAAKPRAAASSAYDRALLRPALLKDKAPDTFQVKFETTRGDFTMTVHRDWAPIGADRFFNLVKHHFFDDMTVFRVAPGFVTQFGISSYPPVAAAWSNANIKDDPVTQSNKRGYVTYAKTGAPNSRSTQIFINYKDNSGLDPQGFAPFAVVDADGMKVVEMFYDQYDDQPTAEQEQITKGGKAYLEKKYPKLDVIKHATLIGAAAAATAAPAKPAATTAKPKAPAAQKPQ